MKCPKCTQTELAREVIAAVPVDRCASCHGTWLDAQELEKLLARDPKALLADDSRFQAQPNVAGPRLNCPRCKGVYLIKLNSQLRPGTILDSCQVCFGIWLDAGELTRLAHPDLLTRIASLFRPRS